MVWSAGQREFVPLLLGLYWLLPPAAVKRRGTLRWVVIEELEMGLHPKAIEAMLFIILDLLWRGYRVCLSTHSPHVLDIVWGLTRLAAAGGGGEDVVRMLGARVSPSTLTLGEAALAKDLRVYYFDRGTGTAREISRLEPAAADTVEANWGGLTELSGRVSDIVARVVAAGVRDGTL
jgi:hypothetical protein